MPVRPPSPQFPSPRRPGQAPLAPPPPSSPKKADRVRAVPEDPGDCCPLASSELKMRSTWFYSVYTFVRPAGAKGTGFRFISPASGSELCHSAMIIGLENAIV